MDDDLFDSLDTAAKEDKVLPDGVTVKVLFGSWSNQKGFPVLKVTRNENGTVSLAQEKYDAVPDPEKPDSSTWWIPYNFATASNATFDVTTPSGWLEQGQKELLIQSTEGVSTWTNEEWLLFNRQQTGYYRVLYDDKNYKLLNKELNDGELDKIHPINRAQILDDLQDFVSSNRVPANNLCDTMAYLKKETSYAPWVAAKKAINDWNQNLQNSEKLKNFKKFVGDLVEPYYKQLSLTEQKEEVILDKLARNMAVNLACEFGVEKCLDDTYAEFKELLKGTKPSQNIRGIITANGIRKATNEEIATLWTKFLNNTSNDERQEILSSLGNIQNEATLEFYLKKSVEDFGDKTVSASERLKIITTIVGGGQKGVSLTIQFLTNATEMDNVNTKIGSLSTIFQTIAARVLTSEVKTQVK